MTPAILVGDRVHLDKTAYGLMVPLSSWWSDKPIRFTGPSVPERGEVVAMLSDDGSRHILIKRVIGLPGDHVNIRHQKILINGRPLARQALSSTETQTLADRLMRAHMEQPPGPTAWEKLGQARYQVLLASADDPGSRATVSTVIPDSHIYVLGDNRATSIDSRHWGPISLDRVLGHIVRL